MAIEVPVLAVGGTVGAILLIVGLAVAYGGFALHQLFLWIAGFIAGFQITMSLSLFATAGQMIESPNVLFYVARNPEGGLFILGVIYVIALFMGLVVGGLFVILQKVFVMLAGFAASALFVKLVINTESFVVPLIVGILGAIVTWKLYVMIIILVTTVAGAFIVEFTLSPFPEIPGPVFGFVLLSGLVVQWVSHSAIIEDERQSNESQTDRSSINRRASHSVSSSKIEGFVPRQRYQPKSTRSKKTQLENESVRLCESCGKRNNLKSGRCRKCGEKLQFGGRSNK